MGQIINKQQNTFLILTITLFLIFLINLQNTSGQETAPSFIPRLNQENQVISYNSTIIVSEETELEITDEILIQKNGLNNTNKLSLSTNGLVSSLSVNANISVQVLLYPSQSNSTIILVLPNNNWVTAYVTITYQINNLVMPLGEAYLLSYGLPIKANYIGFVDIALPPHSIIIHKKVGGETIPLVSPKPTTNYTDGIRTHLRWEPAEILLNQPIIIEFLMEPPSSSFEFKWEYFGFFLLGVITGMAVLTIMMFGIKYWNKRKSKIKGAATSKTDERPLFQSTPPPLKVVNLTDQERKIIYALMDLELKASQETLRKELGWGKSKLSTYLKRLEQKGIITQKEAGRQKIVYLIGPIEM